MQPILLFLNLIQFFPLFLDKQLTLQRLIVLFNLILPQVHLAFLLKLCHLTLFLDHRRPLIHVASGIQRQIADNRDIRV